MSSVSKVEIERAWQALLSNVGALGVAVDNWKLAVPDQRDGLRQLPWLVRNGASTVLVLGYTRREALTALTCMNNILTVVTARV